MPLQHLQTKIERESDGFAFPMRIAGSPQTVRVLVADDAIVVMDTDTVDEELQAQLEADLDAFEGLASDKFDRGQLTTDGVVLITVSDVLGFFE